MERNANRSWIGVLFGLVFFVAGLAAAYGSAGKMIFSYVASSDWIEVPATIHDVDLVVRHGDAITYTVNSSYSYNFNGVRHLGDRVSLSSGSDNLGSYWQDLESTLLAAQRSNEASAIINPNNPSESVLDRTLRWGTVIFGLMFLIIFCGIGAAVMWASLVGFKTKDREERIEQEQTDGIESNQKFGAKFLAAFGAIFFFIGASLSLAILPDALRNGDYAALFVLVFVVAGASIVYYALKIQRAYKRFGPTPLFLDPARPGVGGQLGAQFDINAKDIGNHVGSSTQLTAILNCNRKSKSGKNTSYKLEWQKQAPVLLKQTSTGVKALFLFDIPASCKPSTDGRNGSSIERTTGSSNRYSSINWSVTIKGEFNQSNLGQFERTWELIVDDNAAQASDVLSMPQSFIDTADQRAKTRVTTSALDQLPVSEDTQHINVHSKAGRELGSKFIGLLVGAVFAGIGVFTVTENWWPGYLFALVGGAIFFCTLFAIGKSIETKIDKASRTLHTRTSLFGLVYAKNQGEVINPDQFEIKKTSSSNTRNRVVEYYNISLKSSDKKIRIADGINGKKEAQAVKAAIVERCFNKDDLASASASAA